LVRAVVSGSPPTFKLQKIAGTSQVRMGHALKFTKPTSMGKTTEETDSATVLHVGKYGALSLAQPSLLEKRQNDLSLYSGEQNFMERPWLLVGRKEEQ
jgi:hypothetical protein